MYGILNIVKGGKICNYKLKNEKSEKKRVNIEKKKITLK